ncbi:MAG TPA: acetyl ornithine aminotransferase family protein [Kouleothrix sp.]|mgnify:CR=1 FL=1|uniref:acetyl ornithine aminotransferase family protein n=1 Tax=Kouleothrix sp. TaxID=2779161 RepID=UPI002C179EBA|nr:acetyl ornithine aminotransferase family protein [Kouleothrix sp.]HRC74222.1 acetyl ornithine aminotransferase family protein [Kouleothrix sp.]
MTASIETMTPPLDTAAIPGPRARALVERDNQVYAPCAGRVYPFVIERGDGCYVWDVDGNRYLDLNAGIAVVSAGHAHPQVVRAVQDQAARFIHMAGTDFYSEPMVKFGEKLTSLMPPEHQWQLFPCNSGTEAVEASIKLARYVTGRQGIIAFLGAFHGRSYGSLSLTASKPVQRRGYYPLVPGTFHALYPNPYRPPFDVDPARVSEVCLNYIEQTLFHTIAPPRDVAAIIIEPIQGEGGYVVPAAGFLKGLRQICDQYGILLIADEVQSGVGRTGKMWAFEHEGIAPDIVASAKGLGSGMPIGAMVARRELTERWEPGSHGNTYGGNALACAAAYEVLSLVESELAANAARVGSYFMRGLNELAGRYEQFGDVRGRGLMIGLELVKDRRTREPARKLAHDVMEEAFRRGLLLLTCGASTIRFCPPLVLTEAQADEGLELFEDTLKAVLSQG